MQISQVSVCTSTMYVVTYDIAVDGCWVECAADFHCLDTDLCTIHTPASWSSC